MPLPERLRPKADSYAMKQAAARLRGSQPSATPTPKPSIAEIDDEASEAMKMCVCPKCGYEGADIEFEAGEQSSGEGSSEGDPMMEMEE